MMDDKRGWLPDENAKLLRAWMQAESIYALAASLGRSRMAVLVQATRLGLPARDAPTVRRKWTREELEEIDREYEAVRLGRKAWLDIREMSRKLDRRFDAVAAKLEKRWGSEAVAKISPDDLRKLDGGIATAAADTLLKPARPLKDGPFAFRPSRGAQERKCLSCGKMFWSEGAHNRICGSCKSKPEWN